MKNLLILISFFIGLSSNAQFDTFLIASQQQFANEAPVLSDNLVSLPASASSPENDANSIGAWYSQTATMDITSVSNGDGTYSIRGTANSTTWARLNIDFPVTNGNTYTITFKALEGSGADGRLYDFLNVSGTQKLFTTTEAIYTEVITATTTGTGRLGFFLIAPVAGEYLQIDDLSIIENGTSLNTPNLVTLFDSSSIDATATVETNVISSWLDPISGNDAIGTGTAKPTLHIGTNGNRQVRFDGVDDALVIGQPANLMFTPQTDEFSFVIKLGDNVASNTAPIFSRTASSGSSYVWNVASDASRWSYGFGGTIASDYGNHRLGNDLIILTYSTTTFTAKVNGVASTTGTIGALSTAYDIVIGNRSTLNYPYSGDIEFIAIYNSVLTPSEISAIEAEYNVNSSWWILLVLLLVLFDKRVIKMINNIFRKVA